MSVACAIVEDDQSVDRLIWELRQLLNDRQGSYERSFIPCKKHGKGKKEKNGKRKEVTEYHRSDGEESVIGPDKEPRPGWCHEAVFNTAKSLHLLICVVPKTEVRMILSQIVECLKEEGLRCCDQGGLWKGCVGPLAKKFHIWNQKWKMFGIPPDPAWD